VSIRFKWYGWSGGYFSCRHLAVSVGYNIMYDLPYGFAFALGERVRKNEYSQRYRFLLIVSWSKPRWSWEQESWDLNAPGYVRGLPIAREGVRSSAWTGRTVWRRRLVWGRHFSCHRYEDEV
jgi:hypothetical protein